MTFQKALQVIGMTLISFHGAIHAAEVLWNQAFVMQVSDYSNPEALIYCMGQPYLMMDAERVGTGLGLWARPACNTIGDNTFVKVDGVGVIANESTVYDASRHFAYAVSSYDGNGIGTFDTHADYSIFIDEGESVFLAFGNQRYNPDDPYPTTYGWVELGVNTSGDLVVLASAWDTSGNSIVVGAIPEPHSGLLLLVGGALLALRRRRWNTRFQILARIRSEQVRQEASE